MEFAILLYKVNFIFTPEVLQLHCQCGMSVFQTFLSMGKCQGRADMFSCILRRICAKDYTLLDYCSALVDPKSKKIDNKKST